MSSTLDSSSTSASSTKSATACVRRLSSALGSGGTGVKSMGKGSTSGANGAPGPEGGGTA